MQLKRQREHDELHAQWPCRGPEIDRLVGLLREPELGLPLFVHGPSGCGKSSVVRGVLDTLGLPFAAVDCTASCTARLLFETALNKLHRHQPCAANGYVSWSPCDSNAVFVAGIQEALAEQGRVCLLLEHAEELVRQEELLATLLALPNLCQDKRVQLILVAEAPWADFQLTTRFAHLVNVRFNGYTRPQLVEILLRNGRPAAAVDEEWEAAFASFVPIFVQFFWEICRDLHELQHLCRQVFAEWMAPVRDKLVAATDTRTLLRHAGPCLEKALNKVYVRDKGVGGLARAPSAAAAGPPAGDAGDAASCRPVACLLPTQSKYALVAAYLASRFPARMDSTLFSSTKRSAIGRRGKRAAYEPSEESNVFSFERLLTITASVRGEGGDPCSGELLIQIGALVQKKLLQRASRVDDLDAARFRCTAPRELVQAVARDVKFDLGAYSNEKDAA